MRVRYTFWRVFRYTVLVVGVLVLVAFALVVLTEIAEDYFNSRR